jgi:hypothetical protein
MSLLSISANRRTIIQTLFKLSHPHKLDLHQTRPISRTMASSSNKPPRVRTKRTNNPSNPNPKPKQPHQTSSKLRGLEKDSPEVRISKTLSWLLRHGAQGEGLAMRKDGYVKVEDLVRWLRADFFYTKGC